MNQVVVALCAQVVINLLLFGMIVRNRRWMLLAAKNVDAMVDVMKAMRGIMSKTRKIVDVHSTGIGQLWEDKEDKK